ncbi:unnamed protein product [Blepharisma stoltei]|uniref:Uncharacterized protein n=1 Tax=Blepharisma stoltei TaxID=1481888 RepID=A0AAU9IVW2_9CILI|nr:unnamed protein product [Blepharisma stoltei]
MLQCFYPFCEEKPSILCRCQGSGVIVCKTHILDHISLKQGKGHLTEPLFSKPLKENKIELTRHLKSAVEDLINSKSKCILNANVIISEILRSLNYEIKSINKEIDYYLTFISKINSIEEIPKLSPSDEEQALILSLEEAKNLIKDRVERLSEQSEGQEESSDEVECVEGNPFAKHPDIEIKDISKIEQRIEQWKGLLNKKVTDDVGKNTQEDNVNGKEPNEKLPIKKANRGCKKRRRGRAKF